MENETERTVTQNITSSIGLKDLITIITLAVAVGASWTNLSGQIEILKQTQNLKEQRLEESIKELTQELKDAKNQNSAATDRIRDLETALNRLWRDLQDKKR